MIVCGVCQCLSAGEQNEKFEFHVNKFFICEMTLIYTERTIRIKNNRQQSIIERMIV